MDDKWEGRNNKWKYSEMKENVPAESREEKLNHYCQPCTDYKIHNKLFIRNYIIIK